MTIATFASFFAMFSTKAVFAEQLVRRGGSVSVSDSVKAFEDKVKVYKEQEAYFVDEVLSRTDSMLNDLEDGQLLSVGDIAKNIAFALGCGIDYIKESEEFVKSVILEQSSNTFQKARYYASSKKRSPGVAMWDKRVKH